MDILYMGRMERNGGAERAHTILNNIQPKNKGRNITKRETAQTRGKIHRITIVECPTCGKMVEKDDDHYCPPMRETDPSILVDTPWWEIKEDTASIANESWWDAYVQMPDLTPPRAPSSSLSEYIRRHEQAWRQGYEDESNIWGYNSYYTEPLKDDPTYNNYAWESMEDNWDEESS